MTNRQYKFKEPPRERSGLATLTFWIGLAVLGFGIAFGWRIAGQMDPRNIDMMTVFFGLSMLGAFVTIPVLIGLYVVYRMGNRRTYRSPSHSNQQPMIVLQPNQAGGHILPADSSVSQEDWMPVVHNEKEFV